MKNRSRARRGVHLLFLAVAFIVSTYAVSNLMPLLLHVASAGLNAWDTILIGGDLIASIVSIAFLARAIYKIDKRAGRIRNRVGWFE